MGLRASREEELAGLDSSEHGLESAYADFVVLDSISSEDTPTPEVVPEVPEVAPVPVEHKMAAPEAAMVSAASGVKMTKISMIVKPTKVDELKSALSALGITV